MKKKYLLLLVVLCQGFVSFAQDYYNQGLVEYESGDLHKSIDLFSKSILAKRNLANSYMYRGAANIYLEMFEKAEQDIFHSIQIDSLNHKSFFYLGMLYIKMGLNIKAIEKLTTGIELNNNDPILYDYRAIAKSNIGDFQGAIVDESIAIDLQPENGRWIANRGTLYMLSEQYQKAINDFDCALKLDSMMYPRAYGNKGYSLAMLEFYAEAIEQYSQCLKLLPNAVDVLYLRGKSFLEQGNEEKACLDFKLSSKLGYELANKYASLCEE